MYKNGCSQHTDLGIHLFVCEDVYVYMISYVFLYVRTFIMSSSLAKLVKITFLVLILKMYYSSHPHTLLSHSSLFVSAYSSHECCIVKKRNGNTNK